MHIPLTYLPIHITYRCSKSYSIPYYIGDVLRDALLYAFSNIKLDNNTLLSILDRKIEIPYKDSTIPIARKGFALDISTIIQQNYTAGEKLQFSMTLFGDVCHHYKSIIEALQELRWYKQDDSPYFVLEHIQTTHPDYGIQQLYPHIPQQIHLANMATHWQEAAPDYKRLTMHFITPTVLDESGKYNGTYALRTIIEKGLQRLVELSLLYGDNPLANYEAYRQYTASIYKQVLHIVNLAHVQWKRHSFPGQQHSTVTISGMVGHIQWYGDFTVLHPILQVLEIIHVGKHTSYGFGKVQLRY